MELANEVLPYINRDIDFRKRQFFDDLNNRRINAIYNSDLLLSLYTGLYSTFSFKKKEYYKKDMEYLNKVLS